MIYEGKKLRHELKYYINLGEYYALRSRLQPMLRNDENMLDSNGYKVRSLYFDDMFNTAYDDKVAGTRFREKYRVRIYDDSDKLIRLEGKYKYDNFIAKESLKLSKQQYYDILNGDLEFLLLQDRKLGKDFYCKSKVKLLKPTVIVDYIREAYVLEEGNVRITFDKDLHGNVTETDIFSENIITSRVLPADIMILEIKYDDYLPKVVRQIIQRAHFDRCAISKYVMCKNTLKRMKYYG